MVSSNSGQLDQSGSDFRIRRILLSKEATSPSPPQWQLVCDHVDFSVWQADASCEIVPEVRQSSLQQQIFGEYPGVLPRAVFFDMDGTTIAEESIVAMAAACGKEREVEQITTRAMAGELDFEGALRERVAMLRGMSWQVVAALPDQLTLNKGLVNFLRELKGHHIPYFLVSGGFNGILTVLAKRLGFQGYHANTLGVEGGQLTGTVEGTIVDGEEKKQYLLKTCRQLDIDPKETMAIGDGANDLPMLRTCGLPVGFEPKEILKPEIRICCGAGDYLPLQKLLFG